MNHHQGMMTVTSRSTGSTTVQVPRLGLSAKPAQRWEAHLLVQLSPGGKGTTGVVAEGTESGRQLALASAEPCSTSRGMQTRDPAAGLHTHAWKESKHVPDRRFCFSGLGCGTLTLGSYVPVLFVLEAGFALQPLPALDLRFTCLALHVL